MIDRSGIIDIERLVLPQRIARRPLPEVEIVDMNAARPQRGRRALLSRPLRQALAETLAAGQQTILFLNRRGFATMAYCFACGFALRCKHCDVSLVYHATAGTGRSDVAEQGEPAHRRLCRGGHARAQRARHPHGAH